MSLLLEKCHEVLLSVAVLIFWFTKVFLMRKGFGSFEYNPAAAAEFCLLLYAITSRISATQSQIKTIIENMSCKVVHVPLMDEVSSFVKYPSGPLCYGWVPEGASV